jgi:hypothetical protein
MNDNVLISKPKINMHIVINERLVDYGITSDVIVIHSCSLH